MIIGNGDIGSIIKDREGAIFFCSGVSNSHETNQALFELELLKLSNITNDKRCLFYFSSIAAQFKPIIYQTPYFKHKLLMESCVRSWFDNYNIIRLGNIDWGKNPNTFINYFRDRIEKGLPYEVKDEYRYLISKKELLLLTDNLPLKGKNEISVTGRIVKVQDVVNELLNEQGKVLSNHK